MSNAISQITPVAMLAILKGIVCYCGKNKKTRMSHCRGCYYTLPPELRRALYSRFGDGYEAAYRASLEYLAGDHSPKGKALASLGEV